MITDTHSWHRRLCAAPDMLPNIQELGDDVLFARVVKWLCLHGWQVYYSADTKEWIVSKQGIASQNAFLMSDPLEALGGAVDAELKEMKKT